MAIGLGECGDAVPPELAAALVDYEIEAILGRGGMGAVYRARQKKLDRVVAIKVLAPDSIRDESFPARFRREAQALAGLNHPGITTIYDYGEAADHFWFAMEFVDGVDLRQLRTGGLSAAAALDIVGQICRALQYAHERGVVHRDIKPENVLVDKHGRVKITDFGLAKLRSRDNEQLTGDSVVMGTPHYMAPEQMETPRDVDHRADIYSLGVVLYELLTGELPIGRFQPPSRRAQIDVRIDEVVLRSLEKDRAQRYQSVVEVGDDVDRLQSSAKAQPAEAPRSEDYWRAAACAAFVILIVFVLRVLRDGDESVAPAESSPLLSIDGKTDYARFSDEETRRLRSEFTDDGELSAASAIIREVFDAYVAAETRHANASVREDRLTVIVRPFEDEVQDLAHRLGLRVDEARIDRNVVDVRQLARELFPLGRRRVEFQMRRDSDGTLDWSTDGIERADVPQHLVERMWRYGWQQPASAVAAVRQVLAELPMEGSDGEGGFTIDELSAHTDFDNPCRSSVFVTADFRDPEVAGAVLAYRELCDEIRVNRWCWGLQPRSQREYDDGRRCVAEFEVKVEQVLTPLLLSDDLPVRRDDVAIHARRLAASEFGFAPLGHESWVFRRGIHYETPTYELKSGNEMGPAAFDEILDFFSRLETSASFQTVTGMVLRSKADAGQKGFSFRVYLNSVRRLKQ